MNRLALTAFRSIFEHFPEKFVCFEGRIEDARVTHEWLCEIGISAD